jgi:ankyrin repeat protein
MACPRAGCGHPARQFEVLQELLVPPEVDVLMRNRLGETALEVAITAGADRRFLMCSHLLRPLNEELGDIALANKDAEYLQS